MNYRIEQSPEHGPIVIVIGNWTPAIGQMMQSKGIKSLELNEAKGWKDEHVQFLEELPGLERLELIPWYVDDVSVVGSLKKLRRLNISMRWGKPADFSNLQALEDCGLEWGPGAATILKCEGLRSLHLGGYKASPSLTFSKLVKLESLRIDNSSIQEVPTLPRPEKLKELWLRLCPKLQSLEGIEAFKNLRVLYVDSCKRVRNITPLASLRHLRQLHMDDNGDIETLKPLHNHPTLEWITFFGTRIVDGDLMPLKILPRLREAIFEDRRHYTHESKDFPKEIQDILRKRPDDSFGLLILDDLEN